MGVYENPPKVFTGENGEVLGIFPDIMEEIARSEGWELLHVPGSWQEGLDRLRKGEIDVMPDVSYLEERDLIFDYNQVPVLSDWFQVYRHAGSGIESLLDLDGKRVGALSGSIQERVTGTMMADFGFETEIVPYEDYDRLFRDVAAGTIAAGVTNRFFGSTLEGREGVEETGVVFHPNSLFFAVTGGTNAALLASLDARVGEMKADRQSVYYRSLERWLGETPELKLPLYLAWLLAALAAGMLIFIAMSTILKAQVNARTAELEEKAEALERALADLERAQAEAIERERLHALGQMASGIAHDFNNILTPILAYSEVLVARPERLDDREGLSERLQIIKRAARDGTKIVERMREFYKSREEREGSGPLDINLILEEVVHLARPRWEKQAQASNVKVDVRTNLAHVPNIVADETEMREMFMNLLFNAVDAMPEGGTVILGTVKDGDRVKVTVRDSGTGMTEEVRRNCLQPFFTTKGDRGTGIGLAMVNSAVAKFGGTLDIESAPGEGTTFIASFPAAEGGGKSQEGKVEEVKIRSLRILAVDDDGRSLESLTEMLRSDGHTIDTAGTPAEAQEMFDRGDYDIFVTDHAMPGMSGVELSKRIRKKKPGMPAIMITSFGDSIEAAECAPDCVDIVLRKPAGLAELREAFASLGFAS